MSSHRLLIVGPDPALHEALAGVSQGGGCSIEDARDGSDALRYLRRSPADVLVASAGHNGSDPLKLLRRVRTVAPEARVILTGEPDPLRVIGAIRYRAYSYVRTPVAPGPLGDMVQYALEAPAWKDDIRLVSARPEWVTMDVRCKIETAERTIQFVREIEGDLPAATREDVGAAFRELLLNAIEHGGGGDPRKRVRASLVRTARSLIAYIHDPGHGFSFDFLPHAAISNPEDAPIRHVEVRAEEGKRPGGFGILLTRNLVDELMYNERGNAVLFVKYLDK